MSPLTRSCVEPQNEDAMICKNCNAESPDNQRFCGFCGAKTRPESLEEVQLRLASVEKLVDKQAQTRTIDQKFLDVDTTEKVVTRLMNWAKVFAFFVGIPFALFLLIATLYVGKSFTNLSELAENARESVKPILNEARSTAESAKRTASDALGISQEVKRSVESTKSKLSELQKDIGKGSEQVQQLAAQIREAQSAVSALRMKATEGSNEIKRLSQQIETVSIERNVASIRDAYPVFGQRVAGGTEGWIDASKKKAQEVYVNLVLAVRPDSPGQLDAGQIGQVMASLKNQGYQVFLGDLGLHTTSGRTSQQLFQTSPHSCRLGNVQRPPCLLYFRSDLKDTAAKLKGLVTPAQAIPDDRIRYVEPTQLEPLAQEFLQKSGLDVVIVLEGQR